MPRVCPVCRLKYLDQVWKRLKWYQHQSKIQNGERGKKKKKSHTQAIPPPLHILASSLPHLLELATIWSSPFSYLALDHSLQIPKPSQQTDERRMCVNEQCNWVLFSDVWWCNTYQILESVFVAQKMLYYGALLTSFCTRDTHV